MGGAGDPQPFKAAQYEKWILSKLVEKHSDSLHFLCQSQHVSHSVIEYKSPS